MVGIGNLLLKIKSSIVYIKKILCNPLKRTFSATINTHGRSLYVVDKKGTPCVF
jgi:hypothetical protein